MTTPETTEQLRKIANTLYKSGLSGYPLSGARAMYDIDEAVAKLEAMLVEARIAGMEQAKSRVLRRTEIPTDARNPTRDSTVILGEQIADIIALDIEQLQPDEGGEK